MLAPWIYLPTIFVLPLLLGTVAGVAHVARKDGGSVSVPRWMIAIAALGVWSALLIVLVVGLEPRAMQIISVLMWSIMSVEALVLWLATLPTAPTPPPTVTTPSATPTAQHKATVGHIKVKYASKRRT